MLPQGLPLTGVDVASGSPMLLGVFTGQKAAKLGLLDLRLVNVGVCMKSTNG